MARAFLFVLDSFGIGHAPDAELFDSLGANTFGHIEVACAEGRADDAGLRAGPLKLPNMKALGLMHAAAIAADQPIPRVGSTTGFYGAASEVSRGKDTPSGHWEIAGVPVTFEWGYFPETVPTFPATLTDAIIREADLPGILGDCHASGTEIIARLGAEHIHSGKPICYTSADSVFQIAAHEDVFGLDRLYELCAIVRRLVDPLNIGRVIARPFVGDDAETFERTANRRDFAVPPPEPTLLDRVEDAGGQVIGVGKIGDIFAHKGVSQVHKAAGNMALFDATLTAMENAGDGDLVFTNFVDFDTLYGHRRDVAGYAAALEAFDARLPEVTQMLRPGDMLILTADHGCDPTWKGNDHTRERVPILGVAPGLPAGPVGLRDSFADIGETVAAHLDLAPGRHGRSFMSELSRHA
ncbi:phosphopentomutase [uncultured Nitratireductor sp.]|uniref:phosphopentomutase n=1 Tax=uncultured Nitratireductor sp. TaxID=520953 RepID=UPI0025ED6C9A|nr:phosphopentomutase [uncultured Nitratireductor sp.]